MLIFSSLVEYATMYEINLQILTISYAKKTNTMHVFVTQTLHNCDKIPDINNSRE
jgi:hypothetical protein